MSLRLRSLLFIAALSATSAVLAANDSTSGATSSATTSYAGSGANSIGIEAGSDPVKQLFGTFKPDTDPGVGPRRRGGRKPAAATDPTIAPPTVVATDSGHVIHPEDVLKVEVFQEKDISDQCEALHVSNDYTITLPLIGALSVKGQTIEQVRAKIAALYNKDYIVNPQVAVSIVKYADRQVNVVGSVGNQGRIDFPPQRDLTIIDAIALAGGQTRLADLKHVKLTRVNAKGEPETREIDVGRMMKGGGADAVQLEPDDIVYVPERTL